jgi:hypothetical protein
VTFKFMGARCKVQGARCEVQGARVQRCRGAKGAKGAKGYAVYRLGTFELRLFRGNILQVQLATSSGTFIPLNLPNALFWVAQSAMKNLTLPVLPVCPLARSKRRPIKFS